MCNCCGPRKRYVERLRETRLGGRGVARGGGVGRGARQSGPAARSGPAPPAPARMPLPAAACHGPRRPGRARDVRA